MRMRLTLFAGFILFVLLSGLTFFSPDRIVLRLESRQLQGGKVASVEARLFYEAWDGKLITKFEKPAGQVMVTNRHGELTIYDEKENSVYRTQSVEYSSENNLVYYFLSGRTQDLGLREMGFTNSRTDFEDGLMITRWNPPSSLTHLFSHIELVHDDYMPVYAGYYDAGGKLVKKVYYDEYEIFSDLILPRSITEFNYLASGDSIVSRVQLSDIRINREAESSWFDFKVPDDARILE